MSENITAVDDQRLHPSPRVWRSESEVFLKFRVMTPFRLLMIQGFIFEPLATIWRYLVFLFVLDYALNHFGIFTVFAYLPFTREQFLIGMAVPFAIWLIERFQNYPLSKALFGTTFKISITNDEVAIKKGFLSENYPRRFRIGFAQVPFGSPRTTVYRNSDMFSIVIDDLRRDPIAEVFNRKDLEHIVTNANVALLLSTGGSGGGNGVEVDPVKQRIARLRGGA